MLLTTTQLVSKAGLAAAQGEGRYARMSYALPDHRGSWAVVAEIVALTCINHTPEGDQLEITFQVDCAAVVFGLQVQSDARRLAEAGCGVGTGA